MTLGFSVPELLPHARHGEKLQIGLRKLGEDEWLQPSPDLALRQRAFDARPEAIQLTDAAKAPGEELARMIGMKGAMPEVAQAQWEDMCLLTRKPDEEFYRLIAAAVAFPTDWRV